MHQGQFIRFKRTFYAKLKKKICFSNTECFFFDCLRTNTRNWNLIEWLSSYFFALYNNSFRILLFLVLDFLKDFCSVQVHINASSLFLFSYISFLFRWRPYFRFSFVFFFRKILIPFTCFFLKLFFVFFLSNTQLVFCYVYEKKSKNNVISLCKLYELCNLYELRKLHESNL